MSIELEVQAKRPFQRWAATVQNDCLAALNHLQVTQGSLTLVLSDDETLQALNKEYAGIDHTTDVLSFPSGEPHPASGVPYLGDILISVPFAERQANQKGHDLGDELCLLAVHGSLHLLGYDHGDAENKAKMWAVQDEILEGMGVSLRP